MKNTESIFLPSYLLYLTSSPNHLSLHNVLVLVGPWAETEDWTDHFRRVIADRLGIANGLGLVVLFLVLIFL